MSHWVYILRRANGSYYAGHTDAPDTFHYRLHTAHETTPVHPDGVPARRSQAPNR